MHSIFALHHRIKTALSTKIKKVVLTFFAVIAIVAPLAITGTASFASVGVSISGVVSVTDSASISSATMNYNNGSGSASVPVSIGAGGAFTVTGLSVGAYASFSLTATNSGQSYASNSVYLNEVTEGQLVTDADVALEPVYSVSGVVTGLPAGVTSANIYGQIENSSIWPSGGNVNLVDGSFTITNVPAGYLTLNLSAYNTNSVKIAGGSTEVEVTGNATNVAITGAPHAKVSGTISGIPSGVTSLYINAWSQNSITPYGNTSVTVTAGQISVSYELPVLSDGDYQLSISEMNGGRVKGSTNFSITNDQNVTGVDVQLEVLDEHVLTGVIRDTAGNPVSGATVDIYGTDVQCSTHPCATAGADGTYTTSTIRGESANNATLGWTTSDGSHSSTHSQYVGTNPGFNLSETPTKDFVVNNGTGIFRGKITESVSGTAVNVAGVTVRASGWSIAGSVDITTVSDSSGNYSLSGIPLGLSSLRIQFEKKNSRLVNIFNSYSGVFSLTANNTPRTKDVVLERPAANAGILEGRVTEVLSGQTVPVRGASVYVYGNGTSFPSVSTNSNGEYSIRGLPEGDYWIGASKYSGRVQYQYAHASKTITNTTQRQDLTLVRQASGSGSVSGTVTDLRTGRAIGGAQINLYAPNAVSKNVTADSQGHWSVTGLVDGLSYRFNIYAPGSGSKYEYGELPDVEATSGAQIRNDGLRSILAGTASVTGVIRESTSHAPIPNATVSLYRTQGGFEPVEVVTNSSGRYTATGLPSGSYSINVFAEGFSIVKQVSNSSSGSGGSAMDGLGFVDLSDGEAGYFNGRLTASPTGRATITGHVTYSSSPVEGAWVTLKSSNSGAYLGSTTTDDQGAYSLNEVAAGPVDVFVYSPASQGSGNQAFAETHESAILVGGESTVKDLVVLPAGSITGAVLDSSGKPGDCVNVTAYQRRSDGTLGDPLAWAQTDSSTGGYKLNYLAAGNYFISVKQDCYEQIPSSVFADRFWSSSNAQGSDSGISYVTVTAGQNSSGKDVTLTAGATISGQLSVTTSAGQTGLPQGKYIQVEVYRLSGSTYVYQPQFYAWISSQQKGKYSVAGLAPGTYKLKFVDIWSGNRGYESTFYGDAVSVSDAESIVVSAGSNSTNKNVSLTVKAPVSDPEAVSTSSLTSQTQDQIDAPIAVTQNETITVNVGEDLAGEYVSVWAHSTPTPLGGWVKVAADGTVTATVSGSLPAGNHRIVVQDAENQVVGWSATTVAAAASSSSSTGGVTTQKISGLSNVGTGTQGLDSPVNITPNKAGNTASAKAQNDKKSSSAGSSPDFLVFGGLAALLLAGLAGGIWLYRSRRS